MVNKVEECLYFILFFVFYSIFYLYIIFIFYNYVNINMIWYYLCEIRIHLDYLLLNSGEFSYI